MFDKGCEESFTANNVENQCMHASAGDQTGCYEAEEDNRVYWLGHLRVKRQRKYMEQNNIHALKLF
jgi:hypothetical protein